MSYERSFLHHGIYLALHDGTGGGIFGRLEGRYFPVDLSTSAKLLMIIPTIHPCALKCNL